MLFVISIFSLGFLFVTGTPSQLRLSHSGYEIISFNEQNPDDSTSSASKNTMRNSTQYNGVGLLNLEKVTDPMDENDEAPVNSQQHKRHYESQRSNSGSKLISEVRQNMIELPSKESSNNLQSARHTNVYLTVGIPRLTYPEKEYSTAARITDHSQSNQKSNDFFDDSNHHRESGNRAKFIVKINSKNKEKKYSAIVKSNIKDAPNDVDNEMNPKNQKSSKMFESENESVVNLNRIKALVLDSHSGVDFVVAKTNSDEKSEKIETLAAKSGFPMIAKFPSIQIQNQRSFWIPPRGPSMFSPIYPSGFDILASDSRHKSIFPFSLPAFKDSRNQRFDSQDSRGKIKLDAQHDTRKNKLLAGHEIHEIESGTKDIVKSWNQDKTNQGISSFMLIKNMINVMKDDLMNLRGGSRLSVNLAELLPLPGTGLNVLPLNLMNQRLSRPLERHLTKNSMPLIAHHMENKYPDLSIFHQHGHIRDSIPLVEIEKMLLRDNDSNSKYLDFKTNQRAAKIPRKDNVAKNHVDKLNNTNSQANLVIDIMHAVARDDFEGAHVDFSNENVDNESHEIQDIIRSQDSFTSKNKSKKIRNIVIPAFYQFLTKFSEIILENAVQYETIRENADKAH